MDILKIQLSDFSYIDKSSKHWPGRKLRFTVSWSIETCNKDTDKPITLGSYMEGCICRRNSKDHTLEWSPPMSSTGRSYKSYIFVTPDYYDLILHKIETSDFAKYITGEDNSVISKLASDIDSTLPQVIDI